MQNYLEGQKFFRQQDPANIPYGQPMEAMMHGDRMLYPSGEQSGVEYSQLGYHHPEEWMDTIEGKEGRPRDAEKYFGILGKLNLMDAGLGYKGSDEERMDESALSMFPESYQDRPEPESKSWIQRLLGRQMGGMMPGGVSNPLPYNLGGSVAQQPMAYQLGGLLKYRRSPFG